MKTVTCNNCGWVAFQVSREHAEKEVAAFNKFYDESTQEVRSMYGGKSAISNYDSCFLCSGSYRNFRDAVKGDCPNGCTLNPIIDRNE